MNCEWISSSRISALKLNNKETQKLDLKFNKAFVYMLQLETLILSLTCGQKVLKIFFYNRDDQRYADSYTNVLECHWQLRKQSQERQRKMEISRQLEKAITALVNSGTIVPMAVLHIQVCSMRVCRNMVFELHHIYPFIHSHIATTSP